MKMHTPDMSWRIDDLTINLAIRPMICWRGENGGVTGAIDSSGQCICNALESRAYRGYYMFM